MTLDRPVFIVGLNKSGTSLLYLLLSRHPDFSAIRSFKPSPTGNRTATLYMEDYGVAEGHKIPDLIDKLKPHEGVNRFAAPQYAAAHRLTEADIAVGDREATAAAYQRTMVYPDRRLCEKSPPNLIRTRYLQGLFPDAAFVAITRSPYTNVAANAKRSSKWGTVEEQAVHWAGGYSYLLEDRPHLQHCLTVTYEGMIADVRATMRAVFTHCGVDATVADDLETPEIKSSIDRDLEAQLTAEDRAVIARICGPTMAQLGYAA